jgi:hypothetical protein
MSLTNESNKQVFLPQPGQTSFQFTLKYFNDTDIKVEIKLANGTIVPTADFSYTVNTINNNRDLGADVNITISPSLASGDIVTIFREVPFTQEYDLQAGSTINPTALNDAFDRIVAQNQQQNLNTQRTITFPVSDPSTTTYNVDTSTTNRANRALGFDSNGNITELNLLSTNTVAGNNNKGIDLTDGVIEAKVDSVTTEFDNNGNIALKDFSVSTNKLANNAVTIAKIASTTGTNTNVVTGTKGADGQLVGWDANGDAVDSGYTVTNSDSLGTSDTTIPTQGNVKAYVDARQPKFVAINGTNGSTPLTFTASVRSQFGDEQTWNLSDFTSTGAGNTPTLDINKCTEIHINISIFVYLGKTGFSAEYPDGTYREIAIDEAASSGDDNRMDFVARVPINPSLGQTIFKMKCLRSSSDSRDAGTAVITGATQF